MNERGPSPDNTQYSREQVLDVFRKFVKKGVMDPRDLELSDPEVIEANNILDAWREQSARLAGENDDPGARLMAVLEQTTILVDAGFCDPDYLDEVANDFLAQDLQTAIDEGLLEVAGKIQAKIDEITGILAQQERASPQDE